MFGKVGIFSPVRGYQEFLLTVTPTINRIVGKKRRIIRRQVKIIIVENPRRSEFRVRAFRLAIFADY